MKKVIVTCDVCGQSIKDFDNLPNSQEAEEWVDAGAYGHDLHTKCLDGLTGNGVLKLLELDEIKLVSKFGEREKYIYTQRGRDAK